MAHVPPLRIAQLSDLHIGFDRAAMVDANLLRLREALTCLTSRPDPPHALLLTGDLTEHGDAASYRVLAEALTDLPFPVLPLAGNHDARAALAGAFTHVPQDGGFLHYEVALGGLRILLLDSFAEGRHGGGFCAERADWLREALAAAPDAPTMLAIHHPPVSAGIEWMDPAPDEPWIATFTEVIAGHRQIAGIVCGHLHRPVAAQFCGFPVSICPSTAPPLALDLRSIDPGQPDGRAMVMGGAPGFAIHHWDGARLVTHFGEAREEAVVARYDARMQAVVQILASERGE